MTRSTTLDNTSESRSAYEKFLVEVVRLAWDRADKEAFFVSVVAPWLDVESAEAWWVAGRSSTSP